MFIFYIRSLFYLLLWVIPVTPWVGYEMFGISWALPFLLFVIVAPVSYFTDRDPPSPLLVENFRPWITGYFRSISRFYFIFYIVGGVGVFASLETASTIDAILLIYSLGLMSVFAVIHMHELSHSLFGVDKVLTRIASIVIGYSHFVREDGCHHHDEGDDQMGYVAHRGENVYSFMLKHIPNGIASALALERRFLDKEGKSDLSNSIIQNFIISLILAMVIHDAFGVVALLGYIYQLIFCIFITNIISYIQHYGLFKSNYERPGDGIAWEYDGFLANLLSINMTRHGYHHLKKHMPFYFIQVQRQSPKLPSGYISMVFIALIPRIWFKLMSPRLDKYLERVSKDASTVVKQ